MAGKLIAASVAATSRESSVFTVENDLKVEGDLNVTGDLTVAGGITKGTYRKGEVIEMLSSLCDGSTVEGVSGSYTWPTVTTYQDVTSTSYVDLSGSEIAYTPPTGTSKVVYQFYFAEGRYDADPILHYKFYIDSDEIVYARKTIRPYGGNADMPVSLIWTIPIGGTADTNTGRQASWSVAKTLKFQVRAYSTSFQGRVHYIHYFDGAAVGLFTMPTLTLIAIA